MKNWPLGMGLATTIESWNKQENKKLASQRTEIKGHVPKKEIIFDLYHFVSPRHSALIFDIKGFIEALHILLNYESNTPVDCVVRLHFQF